MAPIKKPIYMFQLPHFSSIDNNNTHSLLYIYFHLSKNLSNANNFLSCICCKVFHKSHCLSGRLFVLGLIKGYTLYVVLLNWIGLWEGRIEEQRKGESLELEVMRLLRQSMNPIQFLVQPSIFSHQFIKDSIMRFVSVCFNSHSRLL